MKKYKIMWIAAGAAAVLFSNIYMLLYAEALIYFSAVYDVILVLLCILSLWDAREKQIPAVGVYALFFGCAVMTVINPYCSIINNLITGGAVSLVLFIVYKTGRVSIGLGDVEVIGSLAFAFGYPHIFNILIMGLLLSMLWGIGLMALKKADMKTEMAFIPFLFLGYVLNVLNF